MALIAANLSLALPYTIQAVPSLYAASVTSSVRSEPHRRWLLNAFSLLIFHHCQSAIVLLEVYNRLYNRVNRVRRNRVGWK